MHVVGVDHTKDPGVGFAPITCVFFAQVILGGWRTQLVTWKWCGVCHVRWCVYVHVCLMYVHVCVSCLGLYGLCICVWGLVCQKQVYRAWISNYNPQNTVGCNYLAMPYIPASGTQVCHVFWCMCVFVTGYAYICKWCDCASLGKFCFNIVNCVFKKYSWL